MIGTLDISYEEYKTRKHGEAGREGDKPQKFLLEEFYQPTEEVRKKIFDVYDKFIRWRSLREQPYRQFNSKPLSDYLTDSREKFWGYLPLSYDVDTPQFFFPETRNQIISILAKIANLRLKPSFEGVEGFDILKATVLKDLFEAWRRGANRKINNFWQFLYTIINGTCVVYVGYNSRKRKVKNITMYDPASGQTEYEEKEIDESDVKEVIVNLEDLYLPKIWEPDLQEQEELIWRTLIKWRDFKDAFKSYDLAEKVMPGQQFADTSIFSDFISYDVRGGDFVEVIKYFNVPKDQYMIIANGVLLNPMKVTPKKEAAQEGERVMIDEIAPLPWNHKKLPFAKTIFEPIDANYFYGMPLAQKVKSPQEALNMLWELMLSREIRSVSAPILTSDPSVELGLEFKAGRIYQVQADPQTAYRELEVGSTSASTWNAMTTLQGIIQRTGAGGVGQILGSRQPRSATEKAQESQAIKEASGLYFLFYQDLLEQKVWLILKNMIQFYTAKKVERVMGDRKFHKILSLIDVGLVGGGQGNREVRITDTPMGGEALKKESLLRSLTGKEKVEIVEVTPRALNNMVFDLKINFEQENSPESERALYLDYITAMWNLFGQFGLLSPQKTFFRVSEKFGENPSDLAVDDIEALYEQERFGIPGQQLPQQPVAGQQPGQQPGQMSPGALPEVNNFNQQMRGQKFGAGGGMMNVPGQGAPGRGRPIMGARR